MVVRDLIPLGRRATFSLSRRRLPTIRRRPKIRLPAGPEHRQEITVLKKAGIIVAAVATGVLAVSSVAFADTSSGNLKNDCAFGNEGGAPAAGAVGGSSLLGAGLVGAVTSAASSITSQANTLNCNNVQLKDLVDQGSNNKDTTKTDTKVKGSYNTED